MENPEANLGQSNVNVPIRRIFEPADLAEFKKSIGCKEILDFCKLCADSVAGKRISDYASDTSCPVMLQFLDFMDSLRQLVISIPPLQQPMRFGNKAFRIWHTQLVSVEIPRFLSLIQPTLTPNAAAQLQTYLANAFGNETRIDYGTGHELFVMIFFQCLVKLNLVGVKDCPCIVLQGFASYMKTMRLLQETYLLEPAGSHGVWGLDDYHCLSFFFGSAQLINHPTIKPSSVSDIALLEEEHEDYLYLSCIRFIRRTKIGAAFSETSPMLYDISCMSDWLKVCSGLLRLFQGEVLFKLPVVQHLLFGELLSMDPLPIESKPEQQVKEETVFCANGADAENQGSVV